MKARSKAIELTILYDNGQFTMSTKKLNVSRAICEECAKRNIGDGIVEYFFWRECDQSMCSGWVTV